MPPTRQEAEAKLRQVIRRVQTAQTSGVGSSQTAEDVISVAQGLLDAMPQVYDPSGEVVNDMLARYVGDFHAFTMLGFPQILMNDFARFSAEIRYEDATQYPDAQYLYQNAWAADHIFRINPEFFVDVGSQVSFCTIVSRVVPCIAIDSRPTSLSLEDLIYRAEEAQQLSFKDGSAPMLTSLHAPEHFGLGRYGDTLDHHGTERAIGEFLRVVAPGGHLIVSMPVAAESQLVFNALRIFTRDMMRAMFPGCEVLDELVLAPDPVPYDALVRRTKEGIIRSGVYGMLLQKRS
ncbi:MAG: DUF268 domain-containing protein [Candidatus Poribacteria bacterium]